MQLFSFEGGVCLTLCPLKAEEKSQAQAVKGGPRISIRKASQSQLPRGFCRREAQHEQRAQKSRKGPWDTEPARPLTGTSSP